MIAARSSSPRHGFCRTVGAALHDADHGRDVGVGGNGDRGEGDPLALHGVEQFQAGHAGHPQIEHETSGYRTLAALEEAFGGEKRLCLEPHRFDKRDDEFAMRRLIVHDKHRLFGRY